MLLDEGLLTGNVAIDVLVGEETSLGMGIANGELENSFEFFQKTLKLCQSVIDWQLSYLKPDLRKPFKDFSNFFSDYNI